MISKGMSKLFISSGGGRNHVVDVGDAAGSGSGADLHLDESFHAPCGAPGVLDENEVVLGVGVGGVVADGEDAVVESFAAGLVGDVDTGFVVEEVFVDFHGDGDGGAVDGRDEAVDVDGGEVLVFSQRGNGVAFLVVASVLDTDVGVLLSRAELIGHDVVVGQVHQAALAAMVFLRAVDEFLLGQEGDGVGGHTILDGVEGLEGADGGEGPARAAPSLVLHLRDLLLAVPVLLSFVVRDSGLEAEGLVGQRVLEDVEAEHLLVGEVGELVDAHGEALSLGVVGLDGGEVPGENLGAEFDLRGGGVLSAEAADEVFEVGVVGGDGGGTKLAEGQQSEGEETGED